MAAFVYFWSSAYEVSGCCGTDTLYPSFSRILATASQPEPSANAPCTKTTFLIPVFGADCAEADSRVPPASAAASMTATQRFFMTSLQLAVATNPSIAGTPGFARTVSFEARAKLYEFARLVRFPRKIAGTDNATGDSPLFFEHWPLYPFARPGQWLLAWKPRECLLLARNNCRFSNCYGSNDGKVCDRGRTC